MSNKTLKYVVHYMETLDKVHKADAIVGFSTKEAAIQYAKRCYHNKCRQWIKKLGSNIIQNDAAMSLWAGNTPLRYQVYVSNIIDYMNAIQK